MATGSSKHRPVFHIVVLAIGFIVGGFLQNFARTFLPAGAVKEFFSQGYVVPSIGPLPIDLIIVKFMLGPVTLDVSLLSLVGVLIAYLIARSLF
jgi:hypothetical protein